MNTLTRVLMIIFVDLFLFKFVGIWAGLIGLGIIIYRILPILNISKQSILIQNGSFNSGMAFLKDYQGPFYKNKVAFQEAANLIRTFELKDWVIIGIYYDKPGDVQDSKLRYSIGIFKKNTNGKEDPPERLEMYCNSKSYYFADLPNTKSLTSEWNYTNAFTMMIGITKFNMKLKKELKNDEFKKLNGIKDGDCKIVIELYETESNIKFYIPLEKADNFSLYRKDK